MYNSEKKNIVKIEENHYEELIVFLKESDRKNRDLDFWRTRINLWWDNNPFFSEKKFRGFIIISNNKITGFFGLIPFNFTFRNTQQTCYAHTSWNVSKDSRFLSLDLFNKVILNHKINLHFNGTPNENVKKILEFNNFKNTRSKSNAYIF